MTGAAGSIGTAVAPTLARSWDLRLTDRAADRAELLDVCNGEQCRAAFAGADAVVHLAAVPDPEASWEALLPANVLGAYEVARAAIDCGVRRLVLASSLQAVSGQPDERQRRPVDPPFPANLYGATKAWAEALGAWVACASPTSVVALRIGHFAHRPPGEGASDRDRAAWLSPRDCAQLLRRAVEADGVRFLVANGVSANRHRFADLGSAAERLGYRPVDDAWATAVE
jgi:nucleoside-diphosphate-sugar epimerase